MAAKRRRFGRVRKLPSGKYQASFVGPYGNRQNAPDTFLTKTDASRWLFKVEADLSRGTWLDDDLGRQPLAITLASGSETTARSGHATGKPAREPPAPYDASKTSPYVPSLRKSSANGMRVHARQRWSHFHTAVLPFLACRSSHRRSRWCIPANPANIPGAGTDRAKERPVASPAQVVALIEAITPRYRAAVLLGAWCGLRRGEIIALRPKTSTWTPLPSLSAPTASNSSKHARPSTPAQDRRWQAHHHHPASRAAHPRRPHA